MADKMRFYPGQRDRTQYVPSVTTVCAILAKPGLVRWQQEQAILAATDHLVEFGVSMERGENTMALPDLLYGSMNQWLEDANDAAQAAASIGIEVHETLEKHHKGEDLDLYPDRPATALIVSYMDWYGQSVAKSLLSERQCYGVGQQTGLPYAGTLDLCALLGPKPIIYQSEKRTRYGEANRLAVVDIKTSNDYYPEMGMQLAAYAASELVISTAEANQDVDPYLLTVRLDKGSGRYYVKEWAYARYYAMFEAALKLWYELNPSAAENYGKKMAKLIEQPDFSNVGVEPEVGVEAEWTND